ncbi:MAG: YkgJ family cysteine cluster protein [Nanoarchaeota archaeon]|nr:YkgJ family cysteine cluster protein [Nanoarchaeota archaeon]
MVIKKESSVDDVLKSSDECKKCGKCCEKGFGFVLNHEISKMAKFMGQNETNFIRKFLEPVEVFHTSKHRTKRRKSNKDKPYGRCVFHDSKTGECKIHDAKPLYCKLGTCQTHGESLIQWYYLNFFVNPKDPSSVREWKIYADMKEVIPGGKPQDLVGMENLLKILNYSELTMAPPKPKLKKKQ